MHIIRPSCNQIWHPPITLHVKDQTGPTRSPALTVLGLFRGGGKTDVSKRTFRGAFWNRLKPQTAWVRGGTPTALGQGVAVTHTSTGTRNNSYPLTAARLTPSACASIPVLVQNLPPPRTRLGKSVLRVLDRVKTEKKPSFVLEPPASRSVSIAR